MSTSNAPVLNANLNPNRNTKVRNLGVLTLLLLGLVVVYFPQLSSSWLGTNVADATGGFNYVIDQDFWLRTEREVTVTAKARFDLAADLNDVPLTVGDWQGKTVPETNQEVMILLQPEQYVQRLYQNGAGQYLWLSMIGGRSSQPFHAPDICYEADGWQFNQGSHAFALTDGSQFYALWLDAKKSQDNAPVEHVVSYFYLFPNKERAIDDGIVLFKLTTSRYGSPQETLDIHGDFVRNLFARAR